MTISIHDIAAQKRKAKRNAKNAFSAYKEFIERVAAPTELEGTLKYEWHCPSLDDDWHEWRGRWFVRKDILWLFPVTRTVAYFKFSSEHEDAIVNFLKMPLTIYFSDEYRGILDVFRSTIEKTVKEMSTRTQPASLIQGDSYSRLAIPRVDIQIIHPT